MKRLAPFVLILSLWPIALAVSLRAEEEDGFSFTGYVESYNRLLFDGGDFEENRNTFGARLAGGKTRYGFLVEATVELPGFSEIAEFDDLTASESVSPVELDLREAYLDLYGFPFEAMDFRIGRQIVAWGKGDGINPTSNVSPFDFSDIFEVGERLGTNAFQANLYTGPFTLTGIYAPIFEPSLLPDNYLELAGLEGAANAVDTPGDSLQENAQLAFKAGASALGWDFSLSYFYGRYTFPCLVEVSADYPSLEPVSTVSRFPQVHVAGADFSGDLGGLGVWGEGGYFIPVKYRTTAQVGVLPPETTTQGPYLRYVLGLDYTFGSGFYVNAQFAHGLEFETAKDLLNDYVVLRTEKKLFHDKLTLVPLALVFSTDEWDDLSDHFGVAYAPEIQFFPLDNVRIDAGVFLAEGAGTNYLARIEDFDSLFLKAKVSF